MKRQLAAILGTTSLIGAAISLAGSAGAVVPEGCQGGWTPFGGGGYCDGTTYADGSYDHCARVTVLGFGGMQCGRVCPPDPANPAIPPPWNGSPCAFGG